LWQVSEIWQLYRCNWHLQRDNTPVQYVLTADFQRTFHTYLHNEQGHIVCSYGSFTDIKPKDKKISAEQTGYPHSKKITFKQKLRRCCPYSVPNFVISHDTFVQKILYQHTLNYHKHYTAISILMYVHGWNPQFYSTYVYRTVKRERKKFMYHITS
jgi:hypothetical protein